MMAGDMLWRMDDRISAKYHDGRRRRICNVCLHSSAGLYNNKNFIVGGEDDMDAQIWRHS